MEKFHQETSSLKSLFKTNADLTVSSTQSFEKLFAENKVILTVPELQLVYR